ncbi:MAG: NADH-quinone oxidoreductase subunit C [Verrucomicrobiales bacterium]|jgi:NADH-quinone oxidoreductase subunit C
MTTAIDTVSALKDKFADGILSESEFRDEQTILVSLSSLRAILAYCKAELDFDYLIDVSSVDNMGEEPRFEMVYELYSLQTHIHLRIKSHVSEDDLEVPSVVDLWPTADWHEREVFDMMGITFKNHPDLRRILMWDGYPYFPLRKDFPLAGKPSDLPEVAFTAPAPQAGGPFVSSDPRDRVTGEPRAKG